MRSLPLLFCTSLQLVYQLLQRMVENGFQVVRCETYFPSMSWPLRHRLLDLIYSVKVKKFPPDIPDKKKKESKGSHWFEIRNGIMSISLFSYAKWPSLTWNVGFHSQLFRYTPYGHTMHCNISVHFKFFWCAKVICKKCERRVRQGNDQKIKLRLSFSFSRRSELCVTWNFPILKSKSQCLLRFFDCLFYSFLFFYLSWQDGR